MERRKSFFFVCILLYKRKYAILSTLASQSVNNGFVSYFLFDWITIAFEVCSLFNVLFGYVSDIKDSIIIIFWFRWWSLSIFLLVAVCILSVHIRDPWTRCFSYLSLKLLFETQIGRSICLWWLVNTLLLHNRRYISIFANKNVMFW